MLVAQSCLTLFDPMDCSPPGSSIHGIFQARVLEWVTISFSRGPFQLRDWIPVSCTAARHFAVWATREVSAKEGINMVPVPRRPLPAAIHVGAHLFNLEHYYWSQSPEAEGLVAALSKLGDTPNETYLNPIRTFHTVSSCILPPFSSPKSFLLWSLYKESCISKAFDKNFLKAREPVSAKW